MKPSILLAVLVLFLAIVAGWWIQFLKPYPLSITPTLTGKAEYCLTCHSDLPVISASHPVESFGCVLCHGGERLALDADLAHSTLYGAANPSDLSVVQASCGGVDCHSGSSLANRDHIPRVMTSIQATYAGAIAQIRYSFGAQNDLRARYGIYAIQAYRETDPRALPYLLAFDPSQETIPATKNFGQKCLVCHLTSPPNPEPQYHRFTGCSACHTPTAGLDSDQTVHRLTIAISYAQCNTCHNRGNYELRGITFQPRTDFPVDRQHDYYQPIAQFTQCEWTLDCVDCHTRNEAMGDGNLYSNKSEARSIECRTCHGTTDELPLTRKIQSQDDLAFRLVFLNPVLDLKVGDTILVTDQGESLWNVRLLPDGSYEMFGKSSGQRFIFQPVRGSKCQQNIDQQESRYCHTCHAIQR